MKLLFAVFVTLLTQLIARRILKFLKISREEKDAYSLIFLIVAGSGLISLGVGLLLRDLILRFC